MNATMINVVKTLRDAFDLTTDENGVVLRSDGSVISHRVNFVMTMKFRQVINREVVLNRDGQEENMIDWTQAQKELRVAK